MRIVKRIKSLLGKGEPEKSELEKRVEFLEAENAKRQTHEIEVQRVKALVNESRQKDQIDCAMQTYISNAVEEAQKKEMPQTQAAINAVQAVERYGFKRYVPENITPLLSPVITIQDLQEHPEIYLAKLSKGYLNFPVGLDVERINSIMYDKFGNIKIDSQRNEVGFAIVGGKTGETLIKAAELSQLNRWQCSSWVHMSAIDFLKNYRGLKQFVEENKCSEGVSTAFEITALVLMTALEIEGTARIKNLSELLEYTGEEPYDNIGTSLQKINENYSSTEMKKYIKAMLFGDFRTSYYSREELISIYSREKFAEIAAKRTAEILARDKKYGRLTSKIKKPIKEYSIGENLVLACYFARNIIEKYATLEDAVKQAIRGKEDDKIEGKCTDYTGIALHYLYEYLIPMNPEKFRNWYFTYDKDIIGDYNHCYLKVYHVNPDQTIDVYFADPTALASQGLDALKKARDITKEIDGIKLPLRIERTAEDLMAKKIQ